ncbi:YHS domain-containing (seleno)protein [Methylobrevis albus]|uniref:Tat pathway signal sequence domain protein n=1 Tax=Methylobrevis albus TaxID=2793297 RepID=A0A931I5C2_9HYPH|nr:YHS domain-containing (seleno)protein [Methylobrevis albus]MBH0239510.1 tat pathway signal sequence domain protein [Methylobrevis albus]
MNSHRGWLGAVVLAVALAASGAAHAGEINEIDGVAIKGYDPVAYFEDAAPVAGRADITAEHAGATFRFADTGNRDAFLADPARYAPQYGGFCAYGTARGYKAGIDPAAFTIVDGKLYLNYDTGVQATWAKDVPGYIARADGNWPEVKLTTKVHR